VEVGLTYPSPGPEGRMMGRSEVGGAELEWYPLSICPPYRNVTEIIVADYFLTSPDPFFRRKPKMYEL
jgi:hypothetical protein